MTHSVDFVLQTDKVRATLKTMTPGDARLAFALACAGMASVEKRAGHAETATAWRMMALELEPNLMEIAQTIQRELR